MKRGWLIWGGLLAVAQAFLFHISYQVRELEGTLGEVRQQIVAEREALTVLGADWALLNDPSRLLRLAHKHLPLQPTAGVQLANFERVPFPAVPAVRHSRPEATTVAMPAGVVPAGAAQTSAGQAGAGQAGGLPARAQQPGAAPGRDGTGAGRGEMVTDLAARPTAPAARGPLGFQINDLTKLAARVRPEGATAAAAGGSFQLDELALLMTRLGVGQ